MYIYIYIHIHIRYIYIYIYIYNVLCCVIHLGSVLCPLLCLGGEDRGRSRKCIVSRYKSLKKSDKYLKEDMLKL